MEYITKAQAIEVAESLRPVAGDTITNAFIKGIEGLGGQWLYFYNPNSKSVIEPKHGVWYRAIK